MCVVADLVQGDQLVRKAVGGYTLGHLHADRRLYRRLQLTLHLGAGEGECIVRQVRLVMIEMVVVVVRRYSYTLDGGECRG